MTQNQGKKDTRRIVLSIIFTLITVVVPAVAGMFMGLNSTDKLTFSLIAAAFALVPFLALLFNLILAKSFSKKKNAQSSQEHQEEFALRRRQAADDIFSVIKKIKRIRILMWIYSVSLIVLCVLSLFFAVVAKQFYFCFLAVFIYFVFYRLIPDKEKHDFSKYSNPSDYPVIHKIAHKAAKKLGVDGKIRILFLPGDNAGIARLGKTYSLQIGTFLLDLLTEEEFEQVLIHEFAHLTVDDARMSGAAKLFFRIMNEPKTEKIYAYLDSVFAYEYNMYLHAASVTIENIADRAVIEHGDPPVAANALAKTAFLNLFASESDRYYAEPYFAPEEKRKNSGEIVVNAFRKAFAQREEFWKAMLANEIQPRNASHPILRNRIQSIGATGYTVVIPDYQGEFRQECQKARNEVDEKVYSDNLEGYAEDRKQNYLEPMRTVNKWKEDGEPITAEITREIINAMHMLMQYDDAEKLCDRIISEEENPFAKAYAYFVKGNMLLKRYESDGIELIYKAIELNSNYIPGGLSSVGEFCCRMGMQKELDEYRQKANELSDAEMKNKQQSAFLSASDNLVKDDMPEEMKQSILDYIKSVSEDVVAKVYLVKKVIADNYSVSAFVIKFIPDTSDEVINRVLNKIFEHLDAHPSGKHFSLWFYDKETEAAVKKVKESCIYMRY